MKVAEIKALPEEFDFYSNINILISGITYHAKRNKNSYDITFKIGLNTHKWTKSTIEFNRLLFKDKYVLKTT